MKRDTEFRYSKLAAILREQILSGYIKPGQYLMSENQLCKHYGLSRTSVRKSLDELLKEGLIIKKMGQGTIVSPDVIVPDDKRRTLRVLATSPSYFADCSMQDLIDAFQAEHPDVEVKLLNFPTQGFWDAVRTCRELGLSPDLIYIADQQYFEEEDYDSFIDLGKPLADRLGAIYPRIIEPFRRNEAILAVPVTFSTVYLAYNPVLFAKYGIAEPQPDWSIEDFIRTAQKLTVDTNADGIVDQYGFSMSSFFSRWPIFAIQNGFLFDENSDMEQIRRAFTFIHDLLYRYRVAHLSSHYPFSTDAFLHGKSGMVLTSSIELAGWRNEQMDFEPKIAAMPFGPEQGTLLLANAFMIPSDCGDAELAQQFIRKALSVEMQTKFSQDNKFLSVLPEVNEALWDHATLETLNISNEQSANNYFHFELFRDIDFLDNLQADMQLFWNGLESVDDAVNHLQKWLKRND
ncbi:extracellular solute-binding protein [Paenibacillus sp. GCM10027626]|uniref:extracellular solute-binding protein n=1 Tax=Paenibacillus sp. GCM10027626 TaxID=3273411 RepID=UPI00363247A5